MLIPIILVHLCAITLAILFDRKHRQWKSLEAKFHYLKEENRVREFLADKVLAQYQRANEMNKSWGSLLSTLGNTKSRRPLHYVLRLPNLVSPQLLEIKRLGPAESSNIFLQPGETLQKVNPAEVAKTLKRTLKRR